MVHIFKSTMKPINVNGPDFDYKLISPHMFEVYNKKGEFQYQSCLHSDIKDYPTRSEIVQIQLEIKNKESGN